MKFHKPPVIEIIGYSGSGKTTLIERLIPYFRKRGLRIAVIKHTSHHHEFDKPGKDSHRLRTAGARAVFVSSPKMVAMFRDVKEEWTIDRMLRHLPRCVDLVIAEGFKNGNYPCLEVFRKAVSADLLSRRRSNLLAVVGDDPGNLRVPHFHQDTVAAIGQLIIDQVVQPSAKKTSCTLQRSF
jgi:molybdopterin-guanine dinucleotide biosynthesis protein MobB